jgi:nucleotide-binding universal stress UspA family protein
MQDAAKRSIVVGYDGSESSERALDWAVDEARLRGAELEIVSAWAVPAYVYAHGYEPAVSVDNDVRVPVEKLLDDTATRLSDTGIEIRTDATGGQAADVLVAASEDADLLVVGSRGHGGFAGLLLGSVSAQCAHHAHCPVVIVR